MTGRLVEFETPQGENRLARVLAVQGKKIDVELVCITSRGAIQPYPNSRRTVHKQWAAVVPTPAQIATLCREIRAKDASRKFYSEERQPGIRVIPTLPLRDVFSAVESEF